METIKGLLHDILGIGVVVVTFLVDTVGRLGYAGVIVLMALESSFVPFPSEVVVPPAGYLASLGQMNIFLVILSGIFGSILGSLLNYWIAYRFGREFLLKYAKYFFINEEKFAKFEVFFNTHGEITTFVGRLIPVIRQYISFPAGLVGMNLKRFIFYTGLGAAIWCTVLAYVGYFVGNNIDIIKENINHIMYFIFPALIFIVIIYVVVYKYRKKRETIS